MATLYKPTSNIEPIGIIEPLEELVIEPADAVEEIDEDAYIQEIINHLQVIEINGLGNEEGYLLLETLVEINAEYNNQEISDFIAALNAHLGAV